MVLRQGMQVAAIGIVIGLIGSLLADDPIALVGASAVFLGVAALASAIPAARASRIPPAEALRGGPP